MTVLLNPNMPATLPPAPAAELQYRNLSAADVAAAMMNTESIVRRAVEGYEKAKAVSQQTLEATVCI